MTTLRSSPSGTVLTQDGHAYEALGQGRLYHGNCLAVMRALEAESVRVIVTSPPYNARWAGHGKPPRLWRTTSRARQTPPRSYPGCPDALPPEQYIAWQRECLGAMLRLLRPDGALFYNHKWRVREGLMDTTPQDIVAGFPVRQIIIWDRRNSPNVNLGYFMPTYEVIYMLAKPACRLHPDMVGLGAVWRIVPESPANRHPAPFPEELPRRCLAAVGSGPVLDPFLGSGTTAVVAERLGYDWIGIEQSEEYVTMARHRLSQVQRGLPLSARA